MNEASPIPHADLAAGPVRDDPAFWSALVALLFAVAAHGFMGIELSYTRGVLLLSPLVAAPLALLAVVITLAGIVRGIRHRFRDGRWLAVAAASLATGGLVEIYCLLLRAAFPRKRPLPSYRQPRQRHRTRCDRSWMRLNKSMYDPKVL